MLPYTDETFCPITIHQVTKMLVVYYAVLLQLFYRPGGEGGNCPPKAKFMAHGGLGQFWGADFENRCYTSKFMA